jgi:hypothetical protein
LSDLFHSAIAGFDNSRITDLVERTSKLARRHRDERTRAPATRAGRS